MLDTHPPTYQKEVRDRITATVLASTEGGGLDHPGGVFVRRVDLLAPEVLLMLRATARVIVPCDGRSLGRLLEQLTAPRRSRSRCPSLPCPLCAGWSAARRACSARSGTSPRDCSTRTRRRTARRRCAGRSREGRRAHHGGAASAARSAAADGQRDRRTHRRGRLRDPPARRHASAGAVGQRRRQPARRLRRHGARRRIFLGGEQLLLSPHAVAQRSGERSGERRAVPARRGQRRGVERDAGADPAHTPYIVRHGAGVSTFEHEHDGIATRLTLGVAPEDPVKLSLLEVTNRGTKPRKLTVTSYVEWTLGVQREHTRHQVAHGVRSRRAAPSSRATPSIRSSPTGSAFCAMSEPVTAHTGDRREFLGRNGTTTAPRGARQGRRARRRRSAPGRSLCGAAVRPRARARRDARRRRSLLGAGGGGRRAAPRRVVWRRGARPRGGRRRPIAQWQRRLSVITRAARRSPRSTRW